MKSPLGAVRRSPPCPRDSSLFLFALLGARNVGTDRRWGVSGTLGDAGHRPRPAVSRGTSVHTCLLWRWAVDGPQDRRWSHVDACPPVLFPMPHRIKVFCESGDDVYCFHSFFDAEGGQPGSAAAPGRESQGGVPAWESRAHGPPPRPTTQAHRPGAHSTCLGRGHDRKPPVWLRERPHGVGHSEAV